jgi:hypothetical protein
MILPVILLGLVAAAFGFTTWKASAIETQFPNHGEQTDIGGYRINALHLPPSPSGDLPAIVFIHGASGNLRDQEAAFRMALEGRAELLFVDRPGHGYSERGGSENNFPDGQAAAIARLMEIKGIDKAIIVGHSSAARLRQASPSTIRTRRQASSSCLRQPIPGRAASNGTTRSQQHPLSAGCSPIWSACLPACS